MPIRAVSKRVMMQPYLLPLVHALRTERDCRRTRGLKSAFLTGAFSANRAQAAHLPGPLGRQDQQLQREGRPVPVNAWQATGVREVSSRALRRAAVAYGRRGDRRPRPPLIDAATLKASRSRAAPTAAGRRDPNLRWRTVPGQSAEHHRISAHGVGSRPQATRRAARRPRDPASSPAPAQPGVLAPADRAIDLAALDNQGAPGERGPPAPPLGRHRASPPPPRGRAIAERPVAVGPRHPCSARGARRRCPRYP